jgi:hypothetical protein
MAQTRHGAMSDLSPLSRAKRKLDAGAVRSVADPQRSFGREATAEPQSPLIGGERPEVRFHHKTAKASMLDQLASERILNISWYARPIGQTFALLQATRGPSAGV